MDESLRWCWWKAQRDIDISKSTGTFLNFSQSTGTFLNFSDRFPDQKSKNVPGLFVPFLRGSRPRPSHRSGTPVADRDLPAVDDHGDVAPSLAEADHLVHRGAVLLYVPVRYGLAVLLVVPTSVGRVRSAVLPEDRHGHGVSVLLTTLRRFRPSPSSVGCAFPWEDASPRARTPRRRTSA